MESDGIRIVLIDDDDAIATLLEVSFELDPRFVLVARGSDGAEALELVRLHRPDAVLMDLQMPKVGGIEATRLLLEDDPSCCVIAFTATSDERQFEAILEAGAVAVLRKPFDPVAFLDAVEKHAADCARAA